jgi:hypothetical protein
VGDSSRVMLAQPQLQIPGNADIEMHPASGCFAKYNRRKNS